MTDWDVADLDHSDPRVASDIEVVSLAAYRIEADMLGVSDFPPLRRTAHDIARAETSFRGIYSSGILSAVVEFEDMPDGSVDICSLVVTPDYFRTGLGSRLVQHVTAARPGARLTVTTASGNVPALALYRQLGFSAVKTWTAPGGVELMQLVRASPI